MGRDDAQPDVRRIVRHVGGGAVVRCRWRHRFVPGAMRDRPGKLSAMVEANETYRLESQKGSRHLTRKPRKRGGVAKRRGINRKHDCLLVARDRGGQTLDFSVLRDSRPPPHARRQHAQAGEHQRDRRRFRHVRPELLGRV
jgi:hypothetical protein